MEELVQVILQAIREERTEDVKQGMQKLLSELQTTHTIESYAQAGDQFQQIGYLTYAKTIFEEGQKEFPNESVWQLLLGELLMDDGQYEEGIDHLLGIPKEDPLYLQALLSLADAYQMLSLPEVALVKLNEAKQLAPDQVVITYALAELAFQQGDFSKARYYYADIMAHPDLSPSLQETAQEHYQYALAADGQFDQAADFLNHKAKDQNKMTLEEKTQLAFYAYQEKDYVLTRQLLAPLYEEGRLPVKWFVLLAKAQGALGEEEMAFRILNEAIDRDPYSSVLYNERANLNEQLGHLEAAKADYEEVIHLDPEAVMAHRKLLGMALDNFEEEDALKVANQAEKLDLADSSCEWLAAQIYEKYEVYDKADKAYDGAFFDLEDNVEFLKDYLRFQRDEGRSEKLATLLQQHPEWKQAPELMAFLDTMNDGEE